MNQLRGNQGPRYRHEAGESAPFAVIRVEKLTPIIGAEIGGVDLSMPMDDVVKLRGLNDHFQTLQQQQVLRRAHDFVQGRKIV